MAGVYKLEIDESVEELKQTLAAQKSAGAKERVQLLYLLKTGHATTVQHAGQILDRNRVTVQTWLRLYREGGMETLLQQKRSRKAQCRASYRGRTVQAQPCRTARAIASEYNP